MKRRNFLMGLSATAVGGAAIVGSGAFDSVEADRTVNVEMTDDADAYLGIEEIDDSPDSDEFTEFSETDGNETLKIDFNAISDPDIPSQGVGLGSEYIFDDMFRVVNQGTANGVDVEFDLDEDDLGNRPDDDPVDEFELIDEDRESINNVDLDLDPGDSEHIGVRVETLREDEASNPEGDTLGIVWLIAE